MKKLILAICVLFLMGCGSKQVVVQPPKLLTPPSYLLEDCVQTPFTEMKTNAEVLISFQSLYLDFKECNTKKRLLRKWYADMEAAIKEEK